MSYTRNTSPQHMFQSMARRNRPLYAFAPNTDFERWKTEATPKVLATLGDPPERVPANPELLLEWRENGIRKQTWIIDVGPDIAAEVCVATPETHHDNDRRPAILCCHGHGPFGKDVVMGDDSSPEKAASIRQHNYDYGLQMARHGFVTFAIDWIGFGSRSDAGKPHFRANAHGRDWCNLYYLHATMLGLTPLAINVAHGMAATSFVASLPGVDPTRLGVMGLSGGGTMALWMSLCDPRFQASEIICYSDLWENFGLTDINYCGMQVAPGLLKLVNLPELQGLLAPRPLLVDIGIYDTCFRLEGAMQCYRRLEQIYQAAGAADRLHLDLFPGEHAWSGRQAPAFFNRYLRDEA